MLTVLSPAKTLDFESPLLTQKHSQPSMVAESAKLVKVLAGKSPDEIGELMSLSPKLAELNFERFQEWTTTFEPGSARPAVLAFKGDVYMGMEIDSFNERDFTAAQKSVRILSGLYGVLRPLDLIHPYRLEMGSRLGTDRGGNLYQFWGDQITDALNAEFEQRSPKVLVNLASQEYFSAVQPERLEARIIAPVFLDEKNGNYKIISFFAKRARGAMAAWMVQNRIKSAAALTGFDRMGYRFDPERSSPDAPTFIRPEAR